MIASPPEGSLVIASDPLVAFGEDGTYYYDESIDIWVAVAPYPDGIEVPEVVASNANRVAGGSGLDVWIYDEGFEVLPNAPVEHVDFVGWLGEDVVVWSSVDGSVAIYSEDSGNWSEHNAPMFRLPRLGASVCTANAHLHVWGGWTDREFGRVASDIGASFGES